MVVMALVALAAWDALSLDLRDTEVLGPLPLARGRVVLAQLTALVVFASTFAVALNAIPALAAPLLRVQKLPVDAVGLLRLVVAHGTATIGAGLLGFAFVFAVREGLRAVLGATRFQRVSALVQGSLVVLLATAFLLLPVSSARVARAWGAATPALAPPPLWFVGLHERISGDVLAGLPATGLPSHAERRQVLSNHEADMIGLYRQRQPMLARVSAVALPALGIVIAVAAAACAWNNRRLPVPAVPWARRGGRARRAFERAASRLAGADPLVRAGFFFSVQAMTRSVPHRVSLATTVGVALAIAVISLHGLALAAPADGAQPPSRVFAVQALVLVVLAAGFRHATRVPAELAASATFALSGAVDARPIVAGVRRAAMVVLGMPALVLLLPVHVALMGPRLAMLHAVFGALLLLLLLELLFFRAPGLPFVSIHEPNGPTLMVGPVYVLIVLNLVAVVAAMERVALAHGAGTVGLLVTAAAGWIALGRANAHGPARTLLAADLPSAGAVQRLGLGE
jgi:hypothetical protein